MSLGRDAISLLNIGDESPYVDNVSGEFMPDDEWRSASSLRPVVPVVYVYVRAAHPGAADADQNFVVSDARLGNVAQCETRTR